MGGKGGSQTTVQSYQPTEQEIRLQKQAADYSEAVAPNALKLNDLAWGLLNNSFGSVQADYNKMNSTAQGQIAGAQAGVAGLQNGVLPEEYQKNMEASIKSGVQNTMGSTLSDLASRGVLNSSVTNKAMQGISDSASNTMAQQYGSNIGLLSGLYNQAAQMAGQPISLSAAAQEAAQNPALQLWNASLGLNTGGTLGALQSVAGQGTTTATSTYNQPGNMFGSLFGGLLGGIGSNPSGPFCFTEETRVRMADGSEKEIRHVKVGDSVLCPDGDGYVSETVAEVMQPHYADVFTVVAKSGNVNKHVNTTLTQPLLSGNGIFIDVADIKIGQELAGVGMVTAIVHSGERKVYDLKVSGANRYYANGFVAKGGTDEW